LKLHQFSHIKLQSSRKFNLKRKNQSQVSNADLLRMFRFSVLKCKADTLVLAHYLSKHLGQETAKWPFQSSSQAATCYYLSNYSKIEAISLLSILSKDTSELAGLFFTSSI